MSQWNSCRPDRFPMVNILDRARRLADLPHTLSYPEPFLDEVMSDPIVRQVIAADKLDESDVRRALDRTRRRLCGR